MSENKLLLNLQECNTKTASIKSKLEEAEYKLTDTTELAKAKKINALVEEKLKEIKLKRNKLEEHIRSLKEKISSINSKIYSGLIKTEKELNALQEEMDGLSNTVSENEDEMLTAMIEQDRYVEGLTKSSNQLLIIEEARKKEIPKLESLISNLKSELGSASEKSENARSECSRSALMKYDQLQKTHKGIAVSQLTGNLCGTCMVSVPTKMIQELKQNISFVFCNSCQRILCISD